MPITKNCLVKLDYALSDTDGNRLNPESELIYLHGGYGFVFAKVEAALEGKALGESVDLQLAPAEAFGEFDEELVVEEALSELPEDIAVGMEIDGYFDEAPDEVVIYTVTKIEGETAVLDANHPLAGRALRFEGTVTGVQQLDEAAALEIVEHRHDHEH